MHGLTAVGLRRGEGQPLFVFPGAGARTDELRLLARELPPGPPVMAIVAVATADDTVETLAARAVAVILGAQPHGPYRLLGYSFGGLLALEAARLLREVGEPIASLGLIDTFFDERAWPTGLFVRANANRIGTNLRELARLPLREALEIGIPRVRRFAARVAARIAPEPAPEPAAELAGATAMAANVAAMATWRPWTYPGPVTLFAATTPILGCDLAELWRPWLPDLTVRRVRGTHLDLVQTRAGARRLADAVADTLRQPRLRVLVATTFRWSGAARLAADLHAVGCAVEAVAPRGSAVLDLDAVELSHRLSLLRPVASLRRALLESGADVVVPFDDRTRHALALLHTRSDATTAEGADLRARIARSLGSPEHYAAAYSRAALLQEAAALGVRTPATAVLGSAADLAAWFAEHPGPAVLKTDGSWGGRDVTTVRDEREAVHAWRELRRRPSLPRALKRLTQERDPWPLRTCLLGPRPIVSIQSHVAGRPANAAIACTGGTALGAVQAEVLASDGPTGPSTVVRIIDHPDMVYAAKSVVASLELSGLCGLDFILDEEGAAHLIELNPRATPTAHLIAADGTDLLTALRQAWGQELPAPRPAPYHGAVALFPQELRRDPRSPHLGTAYHDVPAHAPDLVARVLAGMAPRHRWCRRTSRR